MASFLTPIQDNKAEFVYQPLQVPVDEEGYAESFTIDQKVELQDFFRRFGFVVIRDVLSVDEIKNTREDILDMANFSEGLPSLTALEAMNWDAVSCSRYNTKRGFLGFEPSWSTQAWANRLNPTLYRAYSLLFGREDLVVKIDRYGLMRPTQFVDETSGEVRSHPEWQTEGQWIHWDQNPWRELDFVRVQAIVGISDHVSGAGGFHCVPGFPSQFQAWALANVDKMTDHGLVDVPDDDSMRDHIQQIYFRPGSALLWDSRTPHGNFPVNGPAWRMVSYHGFHPAPTDTSTAHLDIQKSRKQSMELLADADGIPTSLLEDPLNRRLIGLDPWVGGAAHEINGYTWSQIGLG